MKRAGLAVLFTVVALLVTALGASAAAPGVAPGCTTIQQGGITDSFGNTIRAGYDKFGYNYQAHIFVGTYDSSDRVLDGLYQGSGNAIADDKLIMQWSDDWISNRDCDGDGKLDRGIAGVSRGWLTNHVTGDFDSDPLDLNFSEDAKYTKFVKIVYVGPGGTLWGQYKILQDIYNGPAGLGSYRYKIGAPGFGLRDHWVQ